MRVQEIGFDRRAYVRIRKTTINGGIHVEKVIFDMKSGFGVDHYTFMRNVLESLSSTSV